MRSRERIAVLAALNLAFVIADREAADLAADAATQSTAPTADHSVQDPLLSHGDNQRLEALVARLDQALGDDGRLL